MKSQLDDDYKVYMPLSDMYTILIIRKDYSANRYDRLERYEEV